jgi:hypothetical protein
MILKNLEEECKMTIKYLLSRSGNFGTHSVPLALACLNTTGPILELSCGYYSTIMLHGICKTQGRKLLTVDHNRNWLSKFRYLETNWHQFEHVPIKPRISYLNDVLYRLNHKVRENIDHCWEKVGAGKKWGLALIDHLPAARRVKDLERLRETTDVFVLHNTDKINNFIFRFWPYLSTFRYVYEFNVATSAVICSDFVDVDKFIN